MSTAAIIRDGFRIDTLVGGALDNNTYVISSTHPHKENIFVVDPAVNDEQVNVLLAGRKLSGIVLTHGHYDHVHSAARLRETHGCKVYASARERDQIENPSWGAERHTLIPCVVDELLYEGSMLEMGGVPWRVIETPGHTPGSLCFYWEPHDCSAGTDTSLEDRAGILISGDTLFCGTIGRIDFPESLPSRMKKSLDTLATLPDNTLVLPGHYAYTSIRDERTRALKML